MNIKIIYSNIHSHQVRDDPRLLSVSRYQISENRHDFLMSALVHSLRFLLPIILLPTFTVWMEIPQCHLLDDALKSQNLQSYKEHYLNICTKKWVLYITTLLTLSFQCLLYRCNQVTLRTSDSFTGHPTGQRGDNIDCESTRTTWFHVFVGERGYCVFWLDWVESEDV